MKRAILFSLCLIFLTAQVYGFTKATNALRTAPTTLAAAGDASCTSPTGDEFTETWGDSAVAACWDIGPSTCEHTWERSPDTITTMSIQNASSGGASNTVCSKSLLWSNPGASEHLYYDFGSDHATFPADFKMAIRFSALTMEEGYWHLFIVNQHDGGSYLAYVAIDNYSSPGTPQLVGVGGEYESISTGVNISLNTWYYITLRLASTASASYINISTDTFGGNGTNKTFTRATGNWGRISTGLWQQYLDKTNITFEVGCLNVNTP